MEENKKYLTIKERANMAVNIAEMLNKDALEEGILILDIVLHLLSNGRYRIISGRN